MPRLHPRQAKALDDLLAAVSRLLTAGESVEIVVTEAECRVDIYDAVGAPLASGDGVGALSEQLTTVLTLLQEEFVHD